MGQVLPLAFIAPELIARILRGDPTVQLTANQMILEGRIPQLWKGQLIAGAGQPRRCKALEEGLRVFLSAEPPVT